MEPITNRDETEGDGSIGSVLRGAGGTGNGTQKGAKPSTLQKLMARSTTGPEGGKGLRRRRYRFTIDPDVCEPGAFDEPFQITMQSPDSATELEALKLAGQSPFSYPRILQKLCITHLDGVPVGDHDLTRDALWEALGPSGRMLIQERWADFTAPGDEAAKKARDSTTIE